MILRLAAASLVILTAAQAPPPEPIERESLETRLTPEKLAAVARSVRRLSRAVQHPPADPLWRDIRTVLHVHSDLSHDSRGTADQIAGAARAAGVAAVFTSEHPQEDRRWLSEGLKGEREGVLFVPGAELSSGVLVWGDTAGAWSPSISARDLLAQLRASGVALFIAHPEERSDESDWDLPPFDGMEIYNSHADAMDNDYEGFLKNFGREPLRALSLLGNLKRYPQEAYGAIFDEQSAVLARWDDLNRKCPPGRPLVAGIAGNDAHQNVGISLEQDEAGLVLRDPLGKELSRPRGIPPNLFGDIPRGQPILKHLFDPYEVSFRYVSTHLLAPACEEAALLAALKAGRSYVAFDWLADPTGFTFIAENGDRRIAMGETGEAAGALLRCAASLPCQLRLIRDGKPAATATGPTASWKIDGPGIYRVEAWVEVDGAPRPWIYSNPIRLL